MSTDYGAIPVTKNDAPVPKEESSSSTFKPSSFFKIAGAFVVVVLVVNKISSRNEANATGWFLSDMKNDLLSSDDAKADDTFEFFLSHLKKDLLSPDWWEEMKPYPKKSEPVIPSPDVEWPTTVLKIGGTIDEFPNTIPLTTEDAVAKGWSKAEGEPCNPYLGEPWLYGGKHSIDSSATLYFTASSAYKHGIVSGIEVDFYGYYEESQVGLYFGEEKTSEDGTYRSISLALRDYNKHDLCDASTPISTTKLEKITLAPGMAEDNIPLREDDPELREEWAEGSCIKFMGYHWHKDIVGGKDITYKASNYVPLSPMYSSATGEIAAVYFVATSRKQTWPEECARSPDPSQPCAAPYLNFWDRSPGLKEINSPPFYMCSNFCDKNCHMEGSDDGMYTTMHWMLSNVMTESCGDNPRYVSCRSGEYPEMVNVPSE